MAILIDRTYDFMEKLPFFHFISSPDLPLFLLVHVWSIFIRKRFRDSLSFSFSLSLSLSLSLQGFGETGVKGLLFQGNREQRSNFEGNRGTKTILGNREYIYIKIGFRATGEQANLFQGSNGTGPPERL